MYKLGDFLFRTKTGRFVEIFPTICDYWVCLKTEWASQVMAIVVASPMIQRSIFLSGASQDAAEAANAAPSDSGSFSRLTHAAEFYASQAATQAAGLFSYKKTDEGQERPMQADQWQLWDQKGWCVGPWLDPVPVRFLLWFDTPTGVWLSLYQDYQAPCSVEQGLFWSEGPMTKSYGDHIKTAWCCEMMMIRALQGPASHIGCPI